MKNNEKSGGFFSQEGVFVRVGTLIFDFMLISIVWGIMSGILPFLAAILIDAENLTSWLGIALLILAILNIGPATAAAYYTMSRRQREVSTYLVKEFFRFWKENYFKALGLSAVIAATAAAMGWLMITELLNLQTFGDTVIVLVGLQGMFLLLAVFAYLYVFALLARFDMSFKEYIRMGLMMPVKHLPSTLLCLVIFAAALVGSWFFLPGLFLLPGVSLYFRSAILERVFRRYMPDEDKEIEEEVVENYSLDAERQAIIDRYMGRSHDYSNEAPTVTVIHDDEPAATVTFAEEERETEQRG